MRDFIFHNPVKIYFGKGQARHIAQEVERVEGAVLVVYGGGSIKRNGAYDDVTAALREAGAQRMPGDERHHRRALAATNGIMIPDEAHARLVAMGQA